MKLALLTGATGGLGKALASQLASKGFSLLLSARSEVALTELAKELSTKTTVKWVVCDLAKNPGPLLEAIEENIPDLIINNAGFGLYGSFDELPMQADMINVNITSPLLIMQKAISALKAQDKKGVILNVGSAAGYFAIPYFATYSASKACLQVLSEAVDEELRDSGIRVLISCPGQISTSFRMRASQGKFSKTQNADISVEKVADEILKQIEHRRRTSIIDWRYRLGLILSHFLPKRWVQQRLAATILERM